MEMTEVSFLQELKFLIIKYFMRMLFNFFQMMFAR